MHVIDKATKLQTIFDRIELIDTRFEVVRRDVLLECQGGSAEIEERLAGIESDRAFLHRVNVGVESMSDADIARVHEISRKYRWSRSGERVEDFLCEDELANLTIRSGTLTETERGIINHHIDVTIQMLEALPWPRHLSHVVEYAGGHHERMDGKGYPKGLTRGQMSVQARCMGIADIFEALTARDRPYKRGKTLSEALTILGRFKLKGHIDPDLFDIFMWHRVYEQYAREFLEPEQIDTVDPDAVPGYAPPPAA
jgi:hypothetical protein